MENEMSGLLLHCGKYQLFLEKVRINQDADVTEVEHNIFNALYLPNSYIRVFTNLSLLLNVNGKFKYDR